MIHSVTVDIPAGSTAEQAAAIIAAATATFPDVDVTVNGSNARQADFESAAGGFVTFTAAYE